MMLEVQHKAGAMSPHSDSFPDPTVPEDHALCVWYSGPRGGLLVSVDSLREAKLVMKTITATTGHGGRQQMGVQWCLPDQGWVEWRGSDGETIHDLSDEDAVFARPSKLSVTKH